MTDNNIHKEVLLKFTIAFLMLSLFTTTVFSQITNKQLNKFYKNNQVKELEQTFIELHNQTSTDFLKISDNDTIRKINEIFNVILSKLREREAVEYFFLQPYFPKTFIEKREFKITSNFVASSTIDKLRPIRYNGESINGILEFIGPYPYDNLLVRKYMEDKAKLKKSQLKEAERIIGDYKNKIKFIGINMVLPGTWGQMDRRLVPCKIIWLKFNSGLTEVEVEYDLVSSGATAIYELVDGKWKHKRTVSDWIH